MRALETSLLDWQTRYGTEEACTQALTRGNAGRRRVLDDN